ncbi:hypothetical protein CBOM_05088 [Ceraceosorus bombacis]|uniref:Uncharacterized protein n=1 Tax=Ceraceosorus bombacis TaxID=401625 RepID=A0A0N7LA84_9BASI|nr:hypothetical protein CBOM_05088 [Ceraceosorus bombacis]
MAHRVFVSLCIAVLLMSGVLSANQQSLASLAFLRARRSFEEGIIEEAVRVLLAYGQDAARQETFAASTRVPAHAQEAEVLSRQMGAMAIESGPTTHPEQTREAQSMRYHSKESKHNYDERLQSARSNLLLNGPGTLRRQRGATSIGKLAEYTHQLAKAQKAGHEKRLARVNGHARRRFEKAVLRTSSAQSQKLRQSRSDKEAVLAKAHSGEIGKMRWRSLIHRLQLQRQTKTNSPEGKHPYRVDVVGQQKASPHSGVVHTTRGPLDVEPMDADSKGSSDEDDLGLGGLRLQR